MYQLAKKVESFPEYVSDVESVKVLERSDDGSRTLTEWVGVVRDFKIKVRWTEEDLWDDDAYTCSFRQTTGDYQEYSGTWAFEETPDGQTKFVSTIDYVIEIPLVGPLLKALVAKLVRTNVQRILEAVKAEAETPTL